MWNIFERKTATLLEPEDEVIKEDRFKDTRQPVQAIVEAMEQRPKTFRYKREITMEERLWVTTETVTDIITGVEYKSVKTKDQRGNTTKDTTHPFPCTLAEWRLLHVTWGNLVAERKKRYNKILRERVYRKYRHNNLEDKSIGY